MSTIEEKIKNKTNKHTLDSVLERGKALVAQKEFLQALKLIQDYEKEAGKEDSDSQLF